MSENTTTSSSSTNGKRFSQAPSSSSLDSYNPFKKFKMSRMKRHRMSRILHTPANALNDHNNDEEIEEWVKAKPAEVVETLKSLVLAQKFSNIMLDINAALMEQTGTKKVMATILQYAAELIHCERCSVFLVCMLVHLNACVPVCTCVYLCVSVCQLKGGFFIVSNQFILF
eukprot:m.163797 g.163797  ORF g.163797 m.163797 type:complete len:171 (+) comp13418_c1_seq13:156-668(+)